MLFAFDYKNNVFQRFTILISLLVLILTNVAQAQQAEPKDTIHTISPFDFGLAEAETDSARYQVLYKTHTHAAAIGADVSYQGVGTLTVEITEHAHTIPLTRHNDFCGLHLIVKNTSKNHHLFTMTDTTWQNIDLDPKMVDSGNFRTVAELSDGTFQLLLEDLNPWVANREGHDYGAMRKDIIVVHDGVAGNRPVASYATESTRMSAKFHPTDEKLKTITDLTITRDTTSTFKTFCFEINGINNLRISNLNIHTPKTNNLYADAAINIRNCTNLQMEDVLIEGTYSQTSSYGYGIQMNNVWNSRFERLTAIANWGIFGTNNLNNTTLRNCNINRFDIHCYGRDVFISNCRFKRLYNQFSSLYGTLLFESCHFTSFIPVLIETSYNAYTPFDLVLKDCVFEAATSRNYLVSIGLLNNNINTRPELAQKCWPNVRISNLTVKVPSNITKIILFYPKEKVKSNVTAGYISEILIDGLRFKYPNPDHLANFVISNTAVIPKNSIHYDLKQVELIASTERMTRQATKKSYYPGSIAFNLRRNKNDQVTISNSRINFDVSANSQYNIRYNNCQIGMIRYNSNSNGTKRHYDNCILYLNNADDARYYIDNHATYTKCTFVPCKENMYVSFYGSNNDVVIKECKTTRKGRLFYQGSADNHELKGYSVKGAERYWK